MHRKDVPSFGQPQRDPSGSTHLATHFARTLPHIRAPEPLPFSVAEERLRTDHLDALLEEVVSSSTASSAAAWVGSFRSISTRFLLGPLARDVGFTSMALGLMQALQRERIRVGFAPPNASPGRQSKPISTAFHGQSLSRRADCLSPSNNWSGRKDISNDLRATRARRLRR